MGTELDSAIEKGPCPKKCRQTSGCIGMQITRGKNKSCTLYSEVTSLDDGTSKQICKLVKNTA